MSTTIDMRIDLSPASLLRQTDHNILVLGSPRVDNHRSAVLFDGSSDGLILPCVPLPGARSFHIQFDFMPAARGLAEQRLFHIQDDQSDNRVLLELRLLPGGYWFADSYFQSCGQAVILQDPALTHACDTWYTYTLAYDGLVLRHAIDGHLEGSAALVGGSLPDTGTTSIGIRGNRLWPFCGEIRTLIIQENPLADLQKEPQPVS